MKFFPKSDAVFGLDIGYETLKLVQIRRRRGRVSLVGSAEVPLTERILERDHFKNKADTANLLKEAIRKAKPDSIDATKIISALPETFVFTKTIKMPKMSEKEYLTAIPAEASEFLPIPIEQVYIDFQVMISHPDEPLADILVAAAPKKLVDDYVEMASLAGLELVALETKSFAIGRAIMMQEKKDQGLAIVHIGTEFSRISILDSGATRLSSTVSVGKDQILENLGYLGDGNVENMPKITEDVYSQITGTMSMITEELITAIKYHQNRDYKPRPIEKIILCGSSTGIEGLGEYIEKEIKIKTEIAKLALADNKVLPPQYIAAFGLALRNDLE